MSMLKSIRSVSHDIELSLSKIQSFWKDSNGRHFQSKFGNPISECTLSYMRAATKLNEEIERAERII